ncbi:MAG TPA: elongation factor G [Methylomirabilota bacterium]|jgi:elongation factor G|nr:elongation factor G [Methylomirabilota bacterium]
MAHDITRVRNIGFVGHGGVGKTSLVEALLFRAGMTTRLGRVDDGTATTDFDPEEIKRKISINTGVAYLDYREHRFHLVDMPGYGDFIAEARAGLRVVEGAVLVVDAVAGVEVQTEKVSKFAQEYGLPRLVFVNRMDRERADFGRTLESLQRRLKGRFVPLHVPIGQEHGFRGLVDVLKGRGFTVGATPGKIDEGEVPVELAATVQEYRDKLVEAVAETDDDLLARYLEEGTLDDAEVVRALRAAIAAGKLVPVICGSATKAVGMRSLLDVVIDSFPSPAERPPVEGIDPRTKERVARAPGAKEPLCALVFKTLTDPHVGKLTLFRVFSGTLTGNSQVYNATRETRERVGQVAELQGKEQKPVDALAAGDIGVVLKLRETLTGDTLCVETAPIVLPRIEFPEPAISFALQPKAKGDEDKISNALARLAEEDPTLRYHYDPETKQLLISGVGQLHIEVTLERMKRKFNAEVLLLPPRIPYKETVKGRAQVQGRHKKQTGGRGQFGDCWVEIEPLPRGGGFEFVDKIFGGAIPRNFIPSVEKGVRARLERGVLAGYPVVDVRVTLYDGSYHSVDSSDIAFQLAGQIAAEKAVLEARPCLLEPVMDVEVTAPSSIAGDVIGDLNSRRGKIAGMEPGDEMTVVRAQVPMAEMLNYEPNLRSMSGGRGSYSMEFSHYEELPAMLADKVVGEARKEREARAAEKH